MDSPNPISENLNIAASARNTQIDYFCGSQSLISLLDIFSAELQDVHSNAVIPLLYQRTLDAAEGVQLDAIGNAIGVNRGTANDAQYKSLLRLVSFSNTSEGTVNDILNIIFRSTGDRNAIYSKSLNYEISLAITLCQEEEIPARPGLPPFGFFGNSEARGYSVTGRLTEGRMSVGTTTRLSLNDALLDNLLQILPLMTAYKIINKPPTPFGLQGNPFARGYSVSSNRTGGRMSYISRTNMN